MASKTAVAQKCSGAMEIQKYHGLTDRRTYLLTWVGARDTCVSKKMLAMHRWAHCLFKSGTLSKRCYLSIDGPIARWVFHMTPQFLCIAKSHLALKTPTHKMA